MMIEIFVPTLNETVKVNDEGRFELPSREFTVSELRKIAREISKSLRVYSEETLDFDE